MSEARASALAAIRRLRGVSWRWREGAPLPDTGRREMGVIAQEVEAVLPHLTAEAQNGYLVVDYGGLALELARATGEIADRLGLVEQRSGGKHLSDERLKHEVDPLADLLARLRAAGHEGGAKAPLSAEDYHGLVGVLIEAVKELDARVTELERRPFSEAE